MMSSHLFTSPLLPCSIEKKVTAVVAEQNLMEFYRVVTNPVAMRGTPLTSRDAKRLIEETYLTRSFRILYPTRAVLQKTLQLAAEKGAISARIFDLRLAAHAIVAGIPIVATHDIAHFSGIEKLTPELPSSLVSRIIS